MYRADYSNYGSYTIKNEIAKQVQELPNDLKELREIFEDSYSNNLGGMFDKVLKNEEYQEDSTELQYRYTVELGWHTPLEILFEAIGISPNLEGQLKDSSRYRSIIGAMLSAKNGVPIGFKFNKLIQVAQLVLESYPEFYTIFLGICSCYGHRHLLDEQDKSGKLAIKAKEREYKTEILDHTFSEIIEFLCPKLNGRLIFHKKNSKKLNLSKDSVIFFYSLKLFNVLLNKEVVEIDRELAEPNSEEIYDLIKNFLKVRSYDNPYYNFDGIDDITSIKILHFLHYYCGFSGKEDFGLYTRSYEGRSANRELDNFIKLANLLELNDYIIDGMYDDRNSNSLHLNYTFDEVDELYRYKAEHKLNQALQLTISQYEFERGFDHGLPMYDERYRFGVDCPEDY